MQGKLVNDIDEGEMKEQVYLMLDVYSGVYKVAKLMEETQL